MFFNVPQIQYKNPWVQVMLFKNMTPTPFLRFYLGKCPGCLARVGKEFPDTSISEGSEFIKSKEQRY